MRTLPIKPNLQHIITLAETATKKTGINYAKWVEDNQWDILLLRKSVHTVKPRTEYGSDIKGAGLVAVSLRASAAEHIGAIIDIVSAVRGQGKRVKVDHLLELAKTAESKTGIEYTKLVEAGKGKLALLRKTTGTTSGYDVPSNKQRRILRYTDPMTRRTLTVKLAEDVAGSTAENHIKSLLALVG